MRSSFILLSACISTSLVRTSAIKFSVNEIGDLGSTPRDGHKPHVDIDGGDRTIPYLYARSPMQNTPQDAETGEGSKIPDHGNRMIANALQGIGEKLQGQQRQARKKSLESVEETIKETDKMNKEIGQYEDKLGQRPKRVSYKTYQKSLTDLKDSVEESRRARDRHGLRLHEQHRIEQKNGVAIKRIGKLNVEMEQRMKKYFPPLGEPGSPGSKKLEGLRKVGNWIKEDHDADKAKMGGVYLPPRRGKGGVDGKGGVRHFPRKQIQSRPLKSAAELTPTLMSAIKLAAQKRGAASQGKVAGGGAAGKGGGGAGGPWGSGLGKGFFGGGSDGKDGGGKRSGKDGGRGGGGKRGGKSPGSYGGKMWY